MKSWLFGSLIALSTLVSPIAVCADSATATQAEQANVASININQADATQLRLLKGIGAAKALRIIEYRRQYGPFKSINELANIQGIGAKTIEKNRHLLTI